jgi:uncharacterized protein (TIGR00266 family)
VEYEIKGTTLPVVEIKLRRGESVFSESGGMAWMSDGINMQTSGKGGGLGGFLGRALSGESLFLTTYTCEANEGLIAFAPSFTGQIKPIQLAAGQTIIAQKGAFLAGDDSIKLETHFSKKLGAGLFGGEGFVMQKITGPGTWFAEIDGEVVEYNLKDGEILKVDPGCVAMVDPSVNIDVQVVKGVANIFFGEGLFLTLLRGPGRVWLQTMPISGVAKALIPFLPKPSSG